MMRFLLGFSLAVIIACCPAAVRADLSPGAPAGPDPFVINFDENGNATVSANGGPFVAEMGYLAADRSGVLGGLVLTYDLPEAVVGGGVNIVDTNGAISDNLYFYTDNNG